MKFKITNFQYDLILEDPKTRLKRRIPLLSDFIDRGKIEYPMFCDDFEDPYDYADSVIEFAVDEFLSELDTDIWDDDSYPEVRDKITNICRSQFGATLLADYKFTCDEED